MTPKQKRKILANFIEKQVQCGYSIEEYMGKPLSFFDYAKLEIRTKQMIKEFNL